MARIQFDLGQTSRIFLAASIRRLLVSAALLAAAALPANSQDQPLQISVKYRSAETVYLDAGTNANLAVGDRLQVVRDGLVIAKIEVSFTAAFSASCRILTEDVAISAQDVVRPLKGSTGSPAPDAASGHPGEVPSNVEPEAKLDGQSMTRVISPTPSSRRPRRTTRVRGALELSWESFTDDDDSRLDFERRQARLSLRATDVGGLPLDLRIRLRRQDNQRNRGLSNTSSSSDSRDRLYELSFTYAPPNQHFTLRGGRIGANPFVSIGYLDGILGSFAIHPSIEVGGFVGSRSDIENLDFNSSRSKFGLFTRLTPGGKRPDSLFDLTVAGVRENGVDDVSREYVSVETNLRGRNRRWLLFQRAEVDLNRGWRQELSGSSSQISNFSLMLSTELSQSSRLSLSYDRYERYRTEETRQIPEELFDDLTRQGLRARLQMGSSRGLNFSLTGGMRDREGDPEKTYSYGLGVRHPKIPGLGVSIALDALGFSNRMTDGVIATLRTAKNFGDGHRINLTLGNRTSSDRLSDRSDWSTQWVRLGTSLELPHNLFTDVEYEITTGDELEGKRASLGLGYRF